MEVFASQGAPPVSTTPVANLPMVSTTPAVKMPLVLLKKCSLIPLNVWDIKDSVCELDSIIPTFYLTLVDVHINLWWQVLDIPTVNSNVLTVKTHWIPGEDLLLQRTHTGSLYLDKAYSTPEKWIPSSLKLYTTLLEVNELCPRANSLHAFFKAIDLQW